MDTSVLLRERSQQCLAEASGMAMSTVTRPVDLGVHQATSEVTEGQAVTRTQFSLEASATQSPVSHGKVKPVTLCVYTLKEGTKCTMTFTSSRLTTAQQIMDRMLQELGIPNESGNVFSLWLTSKHLQLQLKPYHLPCKLFKRWKDLLAQYTSITYEEVSKDEPILSFQRDAFFLLKEERKLLDPKTDNRKAIDLLFNEAVFNVTNNRYPLSKEEFHHLAGLHAAIVATELGDTNPNPASYQTSLSRFYPSYMCPEPSKLGKLFKQKSTEGKDTQQEFVKALRSACSKCVDPHQLKILYLQVCWHKPFYGSVFFRGQIKKPFKPVHLITYTDKQVIVAINAECLHLFSVSSPPQTLLYLTYDQLSWEYQACEEEGEDFYSSLWIEFDSFIPEGDGEKRVAKRVQVFSRQAPMMDAMIGRCVAEIDKREEELREIRRQQGNEEFLPEVSIKTPHGPGESPRIQRQERNFKENKLDCEIYSEDGSLSQTSGFTLSRILKKRKGKPSPTGTPEVQRSLVQGEEHALDSIVKKRSDTQTSEDSNQSFTTGL